MRKITNIFCILLSFAFLNDVGAESPVKLEDYFLISGEAYLTLCKPSSKWKNLLENEIAQQIRCNIATYHSMQATFLTLVISANRDLLCESKITGYDDLTISQRQDLLLDYLIKNPHLQQLSLSPIVFKFIMDKYPPLHSQCSKKRGS